MAKYQNKAKRNANGKKVYEAPAAWLDLLRQAVEKPGVSSQAYSMFYSYSFGNQLLALHQLTARRLEIGPLASYGDWQKMGRQVRKGESAIVMLVPRTIKRTEEGEDGEEKTREMRYFRYAPTAFALSQTDPIEGQIDRSAEALPEMPSWSSDRALKALDLKLAPFDEINGATMGFYRPATRTIHINPMNPHKPKTLVHELAHSIMHKDGYGDADDRGTAEFEAECVALIVGEALGLGGAEESRGYCQHWLKQAGHDDITDRSANKILATAQKILVAGRPAKKERHVEPEPVAA
jgi:antirestriction protein ArdC